MTHSIEISGIVRSYPPSTLTINGTEEIQGPDPLCGYDLNLKIDGKTFRATSFTLEAKVGKSLVEATVTFGVSDLKINGENVETAFKVVDPDGGFPLIITKDQYARVLEFTKNLLENE